MLQRVPAVFEDGVFRPVKPVRLRDGARVDLLVEETADVVETQELMKLAEQSVPYSFLHDPVEDIYSVDDGEPLESV